MFMSIEVLPVLMKLLLNFGPPSAYDKLGALRDSGDAEIEELQKESRLTVAAAREDTLVMAEQERIDQQKAAIVARPRPRGPSGRRRRRRAGFCDGRGRRLLSLVSPRPCGRGTPGRCA